MIRLLRADPTAEQRIAAQEFYARNGDCFLAWVNEGDFLAIADRSPSGPRPQGSVHESGGAEGNRPNSVGHLLHKRSD